MERTIFLKGVGYMLLSALGLSLVGLFGKMAQLQISLTGLVFFRFLSATVFCYLFYLAIKKIKKDAGPFNFKVNIIRAVLVLGAQYSFYFYIQKASLLSGMALLNAGPLFVPIIERFFLGGKVSKSTWMAILFSFTGVMLILHPGAQLFSMQGLIGIASTLFQAGSQVIFGINTKGENIELSVLVLFGLCSVMSFFPYLLIDNIWQIEHIALSTLVGLVVGLGLASLINQLARAEAYKFSTPARLASFLYVSVILCGLYDWLIFRSPPSMLSGIGALLIILGGVLKILLHRPALAVPKKHIPPL